MDCIIRVIKGPDKGLELPLEQGQALLGRSPKAAMRLTAENISYEHALLTRSGEDYTIENLSAHGTYLDNTKIAGAVKLRPRDQLRLSPETVLRLDPAPSARGEVMRGRLLWLLGVVVATAVVGGVIYAILFDSDTSKGNWTSAYFMADAWMKDKAARGQAGPELDQMLQDAWRLTQVRDNKNASVAWMRLMRMMDQRDSQLGFSAANKANPTALNKVIFPRRDQPPLTEEEKTAAVSQFVKKYWQMTARLADPKSGGSSGISESSP